jgi:hypothetical protein
VFDAVFNFMLPKDAIEEFKKIYKKKFNEELSNEEAIYKASTLLNLYKTVWGSDFLNKKDKKIIKNEYESTKQKN